MKKIGYIIAVVVIIGIAVKVYNWLNPPVQVSTVTTSTDPNTAPVVNTNYRPQSIPFVEHPIKPKVKIPTNVKEKDIEKVITIVKTPQDSTQIIFTKDGNVHVNKQGGRVISVEVTTYLDPIFALGIYPKAGLCGNDKKISLMVGVSFLEIYGKLHLPVFTLDLQGVGIGADYKLFKPISIGVIYHGAWNTDKTIRLTLAWNF